MYEELRIHFQRKLDNEERPCTATCECCRDSGVKGILRSIEREVRLHLERGDKFIGLGPLLQK